MHMLQRRRKLVYQFADCRSHWRTNMKASNFTSQCAFAGKDYRYEMNCDKRIRYLTYQEGKLAKDKLFRLPCPSTRLRIDRLVVSEAQPTILEVKWDYQRPGFPSPFRGRVPTKVYLWRCVVSTNKKRVKLTFKFFSPCLPILLRTGVWNPKRFLMLLMTLRSPLNNKMVSFFQWSECLKLINICVYILQDYEAELVLSRECSILTSVTTRETRRYTTNMETEILVLN